MHDGSRKAGMAAEIQRAVPGQGVDFRALLVSGCHTLDLPLDAAVCDRLAVYFEELKHWSRKINLIARETSELQILENHFLDSLTLLPELEGARSVHLLDVGTGAGFPGLVCKAARPEIALTLVEPRLKRVSFLRHIVRILRLDNVSILSCRVEDDKDLQAMPSFTHITSRAVSEIGPFLAMVCGLARRETAIVCMKGPKWQQELADAQATGRIGEFEVVRTRSLTLPFSGAERALVTLKVLVKST